MKFILSLLRASWKKLAFAMLLNVVAGGLYALSIKFLHEVITSDTQPWIVFYELIGCIVVSTGLSIFAGHYLTRVYEDQVSDLRLSLSQKILTSNFFHVEKNSVKIVPVLNNDINSIGAFIKTMPDFFVSVSKIVACIAYMVILSPQLTTYVVGIYLLVFTISLLVFPKIYRQEKVIRSLKNDLFEHINGLVRGLKELTLNARHKAIYVDKIMGPTSRLHSESLTEQGTLNIFANKVGEMVVIVSLAFIVINFTGNSSFDGGLLLEFLTVVLFILPSLIIATNFLSNLRKVEVALDHIGKLGLEYTAESQAHGKHNVSTAPSDEPLICLRDVEFAYGSEREMGGYHIGPFNLEIRSGEIVYVSGGNGSGKTTLGKLIVGLYSPSAGKLLFKGMEVTEAERDGFRDQFAALFPDSHVFRSLMYIDDDFLKKNGENFIKTLRLEGIVNIREKSLSTTSLSSGQQGRLSLLRSLLEDKEIYLFDEWAANQDPQFKAKFYSQIVPELKARGKTIIVITHDESYFHLADRIIKLEDGHLISGAGVKN